MSVSYALLSLLEHQQLSASGLQHAFTDTMQGLWQLNIGQVTQTLTRLERDGLVREFGTITGPTGRQSTTYALTEEGQVALDSWWREPIVRPMSERDDLITKVVFAKDLCAQDFTELLDVQRTAILHQIRKLNERAAGLEKARTPERLIVEKHIFDLEAQIRWIDLIESLSAPGRTQS